MSIITKKVRNILNFYESDNPGVKNNLARLLGQGALGGTGRLVILPVDQGFEHGPVASFAVNEDAYDPHYHYKLAVEANVSAYAAPLGSLEAGASTFSGMIPTILKINSSNSLISKDSAPNQAVTASIKDALRLGCIGIGFTIYPGSELSHEMYEEFRQLSIEAKDHGLFTVVWSYPRGSSISKEGETSIDVVSYGAHIASLIGAHIVKVKLPANTFATDKAKELYANNKSLSELSNRVSHVVKSCFAGRRIVVFSGGPTQDTKDIYKETQAIKNGGGHGSIIGRNSFQRPYQEGLAMLKKIIEIYLN